MNFLALLFYLLQFIKAFLLPPLMRRALQQFQDRKNPKHFSPKRIQAIYHISNLHFPEYNVLLQEYKIFLLLHILLKAP
jgi:hypothetical protein